VTVCYKQGLWCKCVVWHDVLQVSEKRSEAERETRKRERLEKEARDLRAQVDAKNDEVRSACPCAADCFRGCDLGVFIPWHAATAMRGWVDQPHEVALMPGSIVILACGN
jgi:hypothetical protein